jgi:hypothetical protein
MILTMTHRVKEGDPYALEEGEFSFSIGQKATLKKFTSNEWNGL